jgi:hypothetical protein
LARAVDDAFEVITAGRAATTSADPVSARSGARHAWEDALAGCSQGAPLRALLSRLLADEERGVPASAIDAALDRALPDSVSESQLASARAETLEALAPFRPRMTDEEFRNTLARALAERLRLMLALPRLALTR